MNEQVKEYQIQGASMMALGKFDKAIANGSLKLS